MKRSIEVTGRHVRPQRTPPSTRAVEVASRAVRRRDAILKILDAAYQRDAHGVPEGIELD